MHVIFAHQNAPLTRSPAFIGASLVGLSKMRWLQPGSNHPSRSSLSEVSADLVRKRDDRETEQAFGCVKYHPGLAADHQCLC